LVVVEIDVVGDAGLELLHAHEDVTVEYSCLKIDQKLSAWRGRNTNPSHPSSADVELLTERNDLASLN